jgi:uncharacterized NAD(P)/FAD-binding protein YdhS
MSGASSLPEKVITIVGAGYSGVLTAVNILRQNLGTQVRVILVDRNTRPGRGLAYRTWDDNLLLNVPAGNMSALTDEPNHFVQFCQNIDPAFNAGTFASRRLYGDYLEFILLQETERNRETLLEKIHCEAIAVRQQSGGNAYQVDLADGRSLRSDQVVLAFGHFSPGDPGAAGDIYETATYIKNPWDYASLERIHGDTSVALLGSGLTALDVLFRLTSNNDTRKIYLISRRGLVPQSHRSHPKAPTAAGFPAFLENLPPTVGAYFRALRVEIEKNAAQGGDWRDVINALRPHTPEIWRRFSVGERQKFLSRVAPYWDIHRHRLAPAAYLRLNAMLKSGQVEVIAGYVQNYKMYAGTVSIDVRERHTGYSRKLSVARVVNCTAQTVISLR